MHIQAVLQPSQLAQCRPAALMNQANELGIRTEDCAITVCSIYNLTAGRSCRAADDLGCHPALVFRKVLQKEKGDAGQMYVFQGKICNNMAKSTGVN